MANQLAEFLEERKSRAPELNWEAKKKDWLDAVSSLYAKIQSLLYPSVHKGIVSIDESHRIDITEDFIGTYEVPELRLTVGHDRVVFRPKGFNVFGALGRVDLVGDRDSIPLIRVAPDGTDEWLFVRAKVPRLVTAVVDEGSLVEALEFVMAP